MSLTASDLRFLDAAIALAQPSMFHSMPNPAVGCLLVKGHEVIGRGATEPAGGRHAELVALDDARAGGFDPAGATAYVSLEPCAFQGRTPPCARALVGARVARVVGALTDPHPGVAGAGYGLLRAAGLVVDALELPAAEDNLRGFLHRQRTGRPWVRLKIAASLDGRTAMASGESQWITGPAARQDVQYWRARSCAIVTGAGTVRADNPALTVRDARYARAGSLRQPLRVILDSSGSLPATAAVFTGSGAALRVVGPTVMAEDGETLTLPLTASGVIDLSALVAALAARECNEVLVEAGAQLTGGWLAAGCWDEVLLYLAPKLLGSSARPLAQLEFEQLAEVIGGTICDQIGTGEDLRLTLRKSE